LVYLSEVAGTAKSPSMRFEVEDIEVAVEELRGRGVVFEKYDPPGVKTVEGNCPARKRCSRRVVQGPRREHSADRPGLQPLSELAVRFVGEPDPLTARAAAIGRPPSLVVALLEGAVAGSWRDVDAW
jgi:hypothetical protein